MKNLNNKVAVITGGGSGIGKELALQLTAKGVKVALLDIREENLQTTLQAIKDQGGEGMTRRVDVTDREDMYACKDEVIQHFGQVDIVINNAGIGLPSKTIEDVEYDQLEKIVNINLWGVIYGTKAYLPHLKTRPEAAVVNISSMFGLVGFPQQSGYCITKFAVRGFTETLRAEMAMEKSNIIALSVHPGFIGTDLVKNIEYKPGEITAEERATLEKEFAEVHAKTTPTEAVQQIIKAIQQKKVRVVIGSDARALDKLGRFFPIRYTGIMLKKLFKE